MRRHRGSASFEGYGAVLEALERSLYQVASLTRSMHQWQEGDRHDDRAFLLCYADFLEVVEKITQVLDWTVHRRAPLPVRARGRSA